MKSTVRDTGDASGGPGSIVNTGHLHVEGGLHLAGAPPARSAYLDQVEQIFPWKLIGREAELAELAEFCTGDHDRSYVWWQGPAWAGKSALMAAFVLHPPPGVRVVSFFITARYAGQSDRGAFLEVVIEQLATLLGQPMPALIGEATRQAWYARLLKEAARHCRQQGERLVLVVDGLDEDRGVTIGPGAHSIAALLPPVPPEGMRVVVAGRPNPPVPADVPARHPLRDPSIVRPLSPSPQAQVIRDDTERELDQLLFGGQAERDLLGLLVAAGGGLSSGDLAELAGMAPGEVDRRLRTVSGRSFSSRDSAWRPGRGAKVLVLAHEELHASAVAALGEQVLSEYRARIHAWAEGYRDRGWPAGTPEYLLRGYHQMLRACGEVARMVACATDRARLDRMLDVSGGDAAGLAEVVACQQVLCEQDMPDLYALVMLARTREFLADRNIHIPSDLPAVWAVLGNAMRAEALAFSIAEPAARSIALYEVAGELAGGGQMDRAEQVARAIDGSSLRASALSDLVEALAEAGQADRAEQVAGSITDPTGQVRALGVLAEALARSGQTERAVRVADRAEQVAGSITDPSGQAEAMSGLAVVLARSGQTEWAVRLTDQAEQMIRTITDPSDRSWALHCLVRALTRSGRTHRAEQVARTIDAPSLRPLVLHNLARALAESGRADRAEQVAGSITDPAEQADALSGLAGVLARSGQAERAVRVADRAEQVACSITDPYGQALRLNRLAGVLAHSGQAERAVQVADRAEQVACSITDPSKQAGALSGLAGVLARSGQTERAFGWPATPSGLLAPSLLPPPRSRRLGP